MTVPYNTERLVALLITKFGRQRTKSTRSDSARGGHCANINKQDGDRRGQSGDSVLVCLWCWSFCWIQAQNYQNEIPPVEKRPAKG